MSEKNMALDNVLQAFWALETKLLGPQMDAFLLVFSRVLAFVNAAPVLGRKDINFETKLALAILLSVTFLFSLPASALLGTGSNTIGTYTLLIAMNAITGIFLAFIVQMIFETIGAAGGFITNQIGLQAANIMDPTSKQQAAVLTPIFNLMAALLFLDIGGFEWLFEALRRSFDMFPIGVILVNFPQAIPLDYLIELSGNVMKIGLLIAGPFFVITIVMDLVLGVVNRAAQQIPVFQLSNSLKPLLGVLMLFLAIRPLLASFRQYLMDHRGFF
jgi:flagellar biosynthesis protein FliR